jgi:hypothetical protein
MKRRLLRKILANPVDSKGRTVYVAEVWKRGKYVRRRAICRLDTFDWNDPIMESSGCSGEFAADIARRDKGARLPCLLREAQMKLTNVPDAELLSEVQRRRNAMRKTKGAGTGRPPVMTTCLGCGGLFSAREFRKHKCERKGNQ